MLTSFLNETARQRSWCAVPVLSQGRGRCRKSCSGNRLRFLPGAFDNQASSRFRIVERDSAMQHIPGMDAAYDPAAWRDFGVALVSVRPRSARLGCGRESPQEADLLVEGLNRPGDAGLGGREATSPS